MVRGRPIRDPVAHRGAFPLLILSSCRTDDSGILEFEDTAAGKGRISRGTLKDPQNRHAGVQVLRALSLTIRRPEPLLVLKIREQAQEGGAFKT